MKALRAIYIIVWLYFVWYACYMIYSLLGDESIPLFVSGGLLFVIKWLVGILIIRGHRYD